MSPGPTSPFFTIAPTPYGGRGAFASAHIPKDTLILTCEAPYASVVCRKFKKEVCAWCFLWSWEAAGKSTWNVTVPLEPQAVEGKQPQRKSASGGPNAGVWFCGEECRRLWIADGEDSTTSCHAGIRGLINVALEQCLATMEKGRTKLRAPAMPGSFELGWSVFLQTLEDLESGSEITGTFIEDAWERAERLSSFSRSPTPLDKEISPLVQKNRTKITHVSPTSISEVELDTARFVLAGLLRKCIDDLPEPLDGCLGAPLATSTCHTGSGTWTDVLDLQDNTIPHVQLNPHILASHIRVWAFIKFVVPITSRETKGLSEQTRRLLQALAQAVNTPNETRAILGREHGNVFGIWDLAPEGVDSEMLGWGLYPFGSYFNHDCSPTLHKKAKGRTMEYYTLRGVEEGEELCISYVETGDDVRTRQEALKDWFFECACKKCETELQVPRI